MTIIKATAPTVYQLNSLTRFGGNWVKNPNGSYTTVIECIDYESAENYLITRAEMYYDEPTDNLPEIIQDIKKRGSLTIDAVTAYIIDL